MKREFREYFVQCMYVSVGNNMLFTFAAEKQSLNHLKK